MTNKTHKIDGHSHHFLARLQRSGREIRYWFASNGDVVGVWNSKGGKTYAVGHNWNGHTIVYRACRDVFGRHVPQTVFDPPHTY